MTAQVQFIPEGTYSIKDLDTLIIALETRIHAREVMHTQQAADFLGISKQTLYRSKFPFHKVEGLEGRLYLRTELIERIKKS